MLWPRPFLFKITKGWANLSWLTCLLLTPCWKRMVQCALHLLPVIIYLIHLHSTMSTTCGKRKLPRSYLPFIGNRIDRFPYSKLPTKKVVLQRLIFEIEHNHCAASLESSSLTVQKELFAIWEYAGNRDILKSVSHTLKQIRSLHESYKTINKIPISRRSTESYKKKESLFTTSLDGLFDIAQQNLKSSGLITKEDHDFMVYQ